jgi:hypothetical protein
MESPSKGNNEFTFGFSSKLSPNFISVVLRAGLEL